MAYTQLPTRTTNDANSAADVNQLQDNIDALKGGTGSVAPTTTIEDLSSDKMNIIASPSSDYIVTMDAGGDAKNSLTDINNVTLKSTYDANTILKADSDNTPVALTIDESEIVGRASGGSIDGLTASQVRTILDIVTSGATYSNSYFVIGDIVVAFGTGTANTTSSTITNTFGTTSGTEYYSTTTVTFPYTFNAAPIVVCIGDNTTRDCSAGSVTTTQFSLQVFADTSARTPTYYYIAIGQKV